ncbi:glycosyltransferase [Pseudoclavibacter sp. CFCC 13611]|uniref:glycosyltransferase n=1 Tax=Pseudoclavibacter sp. CFCC 13611 TaxID=2615178 RepID=UPI001300E608|nr:glycosyltransferase [Pseudoclavibacter sp. CFCC 13611]KAB1663006.1 glycosyltransferase family 2 protein [Pseudoclavibacter sp. CFCC 13611]
MSDTKFAIMLPYYGPKALLQQAVLSVLRQQTATGWTLTVLDDAYPDESAGHWVKSLNDPRITYMRNPENLGLALNFQKALELSTGTYTILLGSDDVLLPNYIGELDRLTGMLPDAAIVQPGVSVIDETGQAVRPLVDRVKSAIRPRLRGRAERVLSGEALATSLLRGDWAYFPSIAWKTVNVRSFGFDSGMETALDLRLLLSVIGDGGSMVIGDEVCFTYRRHKKSVSSELAREGGRFTEEEALFREFERKFAAMGWRKAQRAARCHITSRAYRLLTHLQPKAGDRG